jgi:hypothetical protein
MNNEFKAVIKAVTFLLACFLIGFYAHVILIIFKWGWNIIK